MTSIVKTKTTKTTEEVNAYLIKNSKGEGEGGRGKGKKRGGGGGGGGRGGTLTSSRKNWAELYGCIK